MTQVKSPIALTALLVVLAGAAAAAILPRIAWSSSAGVREIHLVVRDMTYYAEGQDAPNPTLHVRRGEPVRILLRNEDAGMSHDFAIRAWNRGTGVIEGRGDAAVEFTAPDAPGEETYACTPHGEMMRGTIRVE
jgi:plastocyanin